MTNIFRKGPDKRTNPIQDGSFEAAHEYSAIMKLGTIIIHLKKIKRCMNHVTYPLSSADISIFSPKISKFCYIKKHRYILHIDT